MLTKTGSKEKKKRDKILWQCSQIILYKITLMGGLFCVVENGEA
jgi:hypothetical protein